MRKITDRIHYIEAESRGRYPLCHSLFVEDDISIIIDPACREELMTELGKRRQPVTILNSHYHEDHRSFNYCFNGAPLHVHELDARGYGPVDEFMKDFSVVNSELLKNFWREFLVDYCKYRPYKIAGTFTDDYIFNLGHTTIQVIHTAGHSAGHCCFFFPQEGVLYLADIDLTSFGPWYASTNSNIDAFILSIEKVRSLKPRIVVTSHGDGLITEDIDARLQAYAAVFERRDSIILNSLTRPRTFEEICGLEIIYRFNQKSPDAFFYWDDRMMIGMHLERLERQGRLERLDKTYSLK